MRKVIIFLLFLLSFDIASAAGYNITHITGEYRLYFNNQHFLTVIDDGATFNMRHHPGFDPNGWGSSWYFQPFIAGANLKYTTIKNISEGPNNISISAYGKVSKDYSNNYGNWSVNMTLRYLPQSKKVTGKAVYDIHLPGQISATGKDLNLFRIASNYLDDVPLLNDGIGDTGDMQYADVTAPSLSFRWIPPLQPGHFPYDKRDYFDIDIVGDYYDVNTSAQGYGPIDAAYKPSIQVKITSRQPGIAMIFGAMYDSSSSKYFWSDNVGITPLVLQESGSTNFYFDVEFNSTTYGEPIDFDGDGYNYTMDCNDNNASVYPGATELCNNIDDDCDNIIDEGCNCTFILKLVKGWNLISIPLILENNSVDDIFGGINYSNIFYYSSGWRNATKINSSFGYWVKSDSNQSLNVEGLPNKNPQISINNGWNLIGYPYLEQKNISKLFNNVTVYMYNSSTWYSYGSKKHSNTVERFIPGYGYWIKNEE